MGALWAPTDDAANVESYLASITTVAKSRQDAICIDPLFLTTHEKQDAHPATIAGDVSQSSAQETHQSAPSSLSHTAPGFLQVQHRQPSMSASPSSNGGSPSSSATTSTSFSTPPTDTTNFKAKFRLLCDQVHCRRSFPSRKDLDRHIDSVHTKSTAFQCQCSKVDTRKDNHDRHVRTCRRPVLASFRCRCGTEASTGVEHLAHIGLWTMKSGCP